MGSDFVPHHTEYVRYKVIAVTILTFIFALTLSLFVAQNVFLGIDTMYVAMVFYILCYIPPISLTIWSYYRTVFTDVWLPNDIDTQQGFRKCKRCHHNKPERTHHCSQCKACVLKMDHHCPWLGTCVGYRNHKFFVLFLVYAFITSLIVMIFSASFAINFFVRNNSFDLRSVPDIFQFFVGTIFIFSSGSMLCVQVPIVLTNTTTIDRDSFYICSTQASRQANQYDLGTANNIKMFFGKNFLKAIVPIFSTEGDGMHWTKNTEYVQIDEEQNE
ncbi:zinc finger protein DHHC domain containing protein, putative [Entamoeba invadens IP1]|uniref:Palmitoyltransferase n=1 Tax=Entamoeba invadens IP1 TaxID=370355 RepID=A0A0A1UDS4_ENTIV|nr:zinc finger protein DHHC domain containing protein, putative [Entamoeba invadens IP1]ELP94744.1 zinc finger protein DHHC domain containing protein, putative [Entamoeba invadens IP1]|eukprot:XP_004261515.1 zinc finger protein DHHC domain containing protein, putative [Entamoeba invadens IP1]